MDPDGVYEKRCSNLSKTVSAQDEDLDGGHHQPSRGRGNLDNSCNVQKKIANEHEEIVECKKVAVEADKPGTASSLSAESNENDIGCAGVPSAPPLLPPEYEEDIAVPPTSLDNNMSVIPPPTPGSVVIPLTTTTTTDTKPFGLYSANTDLPVASAVPVINDASAVTNNDPMSTGGAERVRVGSARVLPVPNDSISRPPNQQHNNLESNDIPQEQHEKIPENACVISKAKMFLALIITIVVMAAVGAALAMVLNKDDNDDHGNLNHAQLMKILYPNCQVEHFSWIGDGTCNGGSYATSACGWDGGDCPSRGADDSAGNSQDEKEDKESKVQEKQMQVGEEQATVPDTGTNPQAQAQTQIKTTEPPKEPEPEPTIPPEQPRPNPTEPPKQPEPDPDPIEVDTCRLPTRTGPFSLTDCKWQSLQAPGAYEMLKFGHSVEIDNSWMAVGAHGAVFMFRKSGEGAWSYHQKITVAGYSGDEYTFYSVLSGDTLVFGVKRADIRGEDSGVAFIYYYDASRDRWVQETMIAPSDGRQGDMFGNVVALHNDRLLVGARQRDHNGLADSGVVYAYYRVNGSWGGQQKISPNNPRTGDEFGARIAFSGDGNTAIITAHKRNVRGPASGAAYVFAYSQARHKWEQKQVIIPSDGQAGAEFGSSVALDSDGKTAIIAAEFDRDEKGAVYIFTRPGTLWLQKAKLTSSNARAGYHFGRSIALYNGALLVGSLKSANDDDKHTGGVSLYTGSNNNWRLNKFIESPSGDDRDQFGNKIAMDKNCPNTNTAVIGARYDSSQGKRSGKAYVVSLC